MNELTDYSLDTENGEKNYNLAAWYESQNHTAPAHSYYLRASERSEDKILIYKSLLRSAFCYQKQGSREGTEKVLIENALISSPDRPEAYYFLSSIYQTRGDWQNCYIYANLGLQCYERNNIEDIDIPEYSGKHLLMFQKMVASWPWGKGKETRELCQLLRSNYYHLMDENQKKVIDENMEKFGLGSTIMNRKVVDAFLFFNEFDVLKLRLDYLNDVIDNFIICESNYTHSGKPKPYHLDEIWEEIPEEIRNKIIRLKYEPDITKYNIPEDGDFWEIEEAQRNYVSTFLKKYNFSENDMFIFGDCDEIPDKKVIKKIIIDTQENNNYYFVLQNRLFFYNFNTTKDFIWWGSYITTVGITITNGCQTIRENRCGLSVIPSAGWHFSYFGGVDKIKSKLGALSHIKFNKKEYIDNISDSIKNKKDLFERDKEEFSLKNYDFNNFPEDLKNSIMKFYPTELPIMSKKIIDCFRFFNEKELLELRFNMLKDYVDIFVILEGTKTQSGIPREELLAKKYIKELGFPEDKFIVLEVELPSNDEDIKNTVDDIAFRSLSGKSNDSYKNSVNARTRERLLLNSLLTIIDQFDDNTVFFVSDCDEIIKPENIPYFSDMALANQNCLIKIPLIELEGKANLRAYNVETDTPVCVDNVFFMCTTSHFKNATPFQMRFNINNPYPIVYITQDGKRIEECGWHFSWMGDNNRLKLKQKSTSHYADRINDSIHKDMNSKELEEFINQWKPSIGGINPWGYKGYVLKEYPVEDLPTQILEHEHLRKFFLLEKNFSKIVDMYLSDQKIQSNAVERNDLINILIEKINAKKYLEIGVFDGQNLAKINCKYKVGVDPDTNSPATFHVTSDEFFKNNNEKFDIIFIDGLHYADQVLRDILNSLEVLNDNGYIVCHDMNPICKEHQLVPFRHGVWNGDCWKAFVELRSTRDDLEMYVVNTDQGCGIIKKGKQNAINITEELTYENFDKNRKEWLNIIEVPEFKKIINHGHETLENTYYVPIPVIGVPIVNGVHWLKRLINSVDYPVKDFFIINNNGRDQITTELDQLCNINHDYIENVKVCHLPSNIGVPAAWNLIIKSYVMEPYWIICNNDVSFTPGFLEEMVAKSKNEEVGIVWPPSINEQFASYDLGSFECFLLKDSAVKKCGLFDENLYPAYCEDCDYLLKIKKNNIKGSFVHSHYYHGNTKDYSQSGSQTSKIEGDLMTRKIFDSHMLNKEYLNSVWGQNWENWHQFANDNYNLHNEYKQYDIEFNRKKHLGF